MTVRVPTPEQRKAIVAAGNDVLVEAGAGSGKTGVMVDRYCRLVCDEGASPDSVLAFTFTDKAAAELRERIRAAIELRADAGSERARDLLDGLGSAWVMTIHGFCNRLLSSHPVAVGIDPRFRVLDAAETDRAAHEAFDEALEEFLEGGNHEREQTVAAFDVAGLRGIVIAVHAELRSRGFAEPELPEAPESDVPSAIRRTIEAAELALPELKPESGHLELLERALATLRELDPVAEAPGLDALTALQTEKGGKALADYREAIDAAVAAVAEAGEGGRRLSPPRNPARALLRAIHGRKGTARGPRLRGPPDPRDAIARAVRARRRLQHPLQPPVGRRVPGHQPLPAPPDRGSAGAERPR